VNEPFVKSRSAAARLSTSGSGQPVTAGRGSTGRRLCQHRLPGLRARLLSRGEPTRGLVFIAVLILLLCAPRFGRGEENEEEPVEARIEPRFQLTAQHFDQLMFRGRVVTVRENGKTVTRSYSTQFRPSLETAYAKEIEQLTNECKLTDQQKKKIQLAARGDVVRLMDRIEQLRQKCTNSELHQAEYSALVAELQGFSYAAIAMVSSPSSLFRKSLRRCLTTEQMFLYAAAEHNRQVAMLESALDQLDRTNGRHVERVLDPLDYTKRSLVVGKLTPEARRKIIEIMLANIKLPPASHPYAMQIVFLEVAKQEERLKAVLTESQWVNVQNQLANARRMEAAFQRMGVWPLPTWDEDPELSDEDGN
jgi:hypothetical protein